MRKWVERPAVGGGGFCCLLRGHARSSLSFSFQRKMREGENGLQRQLTQSISCCWGPTAPSPSVCKRPPVCNPPSPSVCAPPPPFVWTSRPLHHTSHVLDVLALLQPRSLIALFYSALFLSFCHASFFFSPLFLSSLLPCLFLRVSNAPLFASSTSHFFAFHVPLLRVPCPSSSLLPYFSLKVFIF